MDNQKSNEGTGSNLGKDSTQKGTSGSQQSGSGSPNVSGGGNMGSSGSGSMGSSKNDNMQSSSIGKDSLSSGTNASSSASSAGGLTGNKGASSSGNQASTSSSSLGSSSSGNQASASPGSSASSSSGSMGGGSAGSMGSSASSSMGKDMDKGMMPKNADDVHNVIDKAGESAQPVVDRLVSGAHAGVDKMSEMFSGASGSMDDRKRQVTDAYNNFTATGREYVRNSPGTAVLGALAAGYLLSKIFGGRRH